MHRRLYSREDEEEDDKEEKAGKFAMWLLIQLCYFHKKKSKLFKVLSVLYNANAQEQEERKEGEEKER